MARELRIAGSAAIAAVLVCVACHGSGSKETPKTSVTAAPSAMPTDGSPVLAELDGQVITLRDFDERLSRQPLALRMKYRSAEARRRLLDDMVHLELLADEARRRGIDRLPEIRDRISELLAEELTSEVFATEATASDVTDAEVKAYYDAHAAEFHTPEVRELKDVAVLIRQRLRAEHRARALADFVDGLRARAHATVHAERLGAAAAPPSPSASASAARTD